MDVHVDLDDPGALLRDHVVVDPTPFYDRLRRDAPVWRVPGQDTYLVSDPELIREVVGRTADFSSNLVSMVRADGAGCPVAFDLLPFGDEGNVLATADPPTHTAQRKLLQPHLSPRAVAELAPVVRAAVDDGIDRLLAAGGGDVVELLADPVPATMICHVIGASPDGAADVTPAVLAIAPLLDGITDAAGVDAAGAAALDLFTYVDAELAAAQARPAGERIGLLAVLADAIDAGRLTVDQARNILMQLFNAGTETTSSLIATSVERVATDHDLQTELRAHPDRIPAAIERLLVESGPFQFHYRFVPADTELAGTAIPAGSRVLLMWAAADRGNDGDGAHFAFGKGAHFCIGAPLARLEARIVLEQLLARTTTIDLDPGRPPTQRPSIFLRRHATLPVTVAA